MERESPETRWWKICNGIYTPPLDYVTKIDEILEQVIKELGGGKEHRQLLELRRSWRSVLGEELAQGIESVGDQGATLVVKCTDHLLAQDLQFQSEEILDRANAFMGKKFFLNVRVAVVQS